MAQHPGYHAAESGTYTGGDIIGCFDYLEGIWIIGGRKIDLEWEHLTWFGLVAYPFWGSLPSLSSSSYIRYDSASRMGVQGIGDILGLGCGCTWLANHSTEHPIVKRRHTRQIGLKFADQ